MEATRSSKIVSQSRRPQPESLLPWKPQISYWYLICLFVRYFSHTHDLAHHQSRRLPTKCQVNFNNIYCLFLTCTDLSCKCIYYIFALRFTWYTALLNSLKKLNLMCNATFLTKILSWINYGPEIMYVFQLCWQPHNRSQNILSMCSCPSTIFFTSAEFLQQSSVQYIVLTVVHSTWHFIRMCKC
jgi:hypothetical protein